MGRPSIPIDRERLGQLVAAGRTKDEIAKLFNVSKSRIEKEVRQAYGPVGPPRVTQGDKVSAVPLMPEDVPEDADEASLDQWLRWVTEAGRAAAAEGNVAAIGAMGRVAATLHDRKRKLRPPPVADPNANPDFIAAAQRVRTRWQTLIAGVASRLT